MTAADYALFVAPLLAGSVFLIRFADRFIRWELIRRSALTIDAFHKKGNGILIDKGILRFPGIHLVGSSRAWVAGEIAFCVTAILLFGRNPSTANAVLSIFLGGSVGVAAFFLSAREAARRQVDAVRSALPVASFLLSLMLEAGLASSAALPEVARALPVGPLAGELNDIHHARLLGVSRGAAIERSRCRVPLDDYRAFLNLVQQGERLGIALSKGLRELSAKMMEAQGHRAETLAQQAAVKLLFPLVVFIFPSVFLIILSPVVLSLLELHGR